ncbi:MULTISPECIES: ABC transporter permease [Brenneria]|uniref:ABC transporter permease n=1 Tax=Brenneria nigrifluens DSM 30175 = ATCC 13028 TaxID=1121120 RepID=A0A2U1UR77_9GAMM|nr:MULTISPECIES: ABC transporter permease [Brenneria]EHD22347.1 ABC-type transporter, integral membrane subunit [Brenneria sp. EniD312]PWC24167.1 ABC transporter permease [Brenneria nigrifluens] [Brenneria nigrifluens DSM 30175 = ATCC 13028]QCR05360.1 ABC transporter permease [Brenneria nigrifluens] [Brenneria nigrifluens DSM 30175 = ATCC 13028]
MRWLLQPSAAVGLTILLAVLAAAGAATWFFPDDPMNMVGVPYLWPGQDPQFPLGTDLMGRDILAGLLHGARVSLLVGVASTVIALLIGIAVGVASGFYRGRVDSVLTAVTTLFQTIPAFLLAIILVAVLQPSINTIIFALGITSWTSIARLVRTEFLALREREFVRASISLGASDMHLIFREILPNAWTPVVVSTALLIANAILSEAGLSFLGLGDPNVVSWGSMIGTGRDALRTGWYMTALPGVAIMLTVMTLNLLSDALHTALNPRLRRRGAALPVL